RSARARNEFTFQVANFIMTSLPGQDIVSYVLWRTYDCGEKLVEVTSLSVLSVAAVDTGG
ncbi:MAG: hypothetical protein L0L05_01385, partial [Yaniella sp.]|nr:hypothetical protein [Yaniella sp.]